MKFCWTCILLSVVFSIKVKSQDTLFAKYYSLYNDSSIAFDRVIQDNIPLDEKVSYQVKKAYYLKANKYYEDAGDAFGRIYIEDLNDTLKFNVLFQSAFCYYMAEMFEEAQSELVYINSYVADSALASSSIPLQALILNELAFWEEAHQLLDDYVCNSAHQTDGIANRIDSIYQTKRQPKLKDPERAESLNTFLPGLGYIYAGYLSEGIVNTGAQLFFLGLTGAGIYYHYYVSAALGGFQIFSRFYKGGLSRTPFLVEKRNYLLKKEYNQKLKKIILEL